jgi:glycosyltransferase involved in cell wall biosynthesis
VRKFNLLHFVTKLELGGAQQSILYALKNFDRNHFRVFLVSGTEGFLVEEALRLPRTQVILLPGLKHPIRPPYDLATLAHLTKILRRHKIDLVHTHSSKAGIIGRVAGRIAGVPAIVHTIHGWSFNDYQRPLERKFYIGLERLTAKFTDRLIVVSATDIDKGLEEGIGRPEQYQMVRCGIEIDKFQYTRINIRKKREELGILSGGPLIGMIACFKPQKAPLDFIRAAGIVNRQFPRANFLLVGDGILRPQIESWIAQMNLNSQVILSGWREDIPEILASIDMLVLSSLWEGLPRVFLQAMAAGKPIVATAVDGAREVILDGVNGYLVPPRQPEKLAEKIMELLTHPRRAKKMGMQGRKLLNSSFDIDHMVRKLEEIYLYLLEEKLS